MNLYFTAMRKIIIPYLLFSALFINKAFVQEAGEKKGWPSVERSAFIIECIKSAKVNMSEDSARSYCYCMQEKIEKKYPAIEDVAKLSAADMQSPEWQKEIKNCLTGISAWSATDRSDFLSECIASAKAGMTEEKAKNYCQCMMFKVEKKYPSPADAGNLTKEDLQSPEWKKIIQSCLEF
jgi:hypothetical protein